jgi:hypothetical protein
LYPDIYFTTTCPKWQVEFGFGVVTFPPMKKYIIWFFVIVAAVITGSLISSWIMKRQNAVLQTEQQKQQNADVAKKSIAWENRPKIGFNTAPTSPTYC